MARPRHRLPGTSARHRTRNADDLRALTSAQIDCFPEVPMVDVLDPRAVVGQHTAVERVVRVRYRPSDAPHLVFHDRHGWYCESHGPSCPAVALARA